MRDFKNHLPMFMYAIIMIAFFVVLLSSCDDKGIRLSEVKHINFVNPEERYGALVDRYYRLEKLQTRQNLRIADRVRAIQVQTEILFLMSKEIEAMGMDKLYDLE